MALIIAMSHAIGNDFHSLLCQIRLPKNFQTFARNFSRRGLTLQFSFGNYIADIDTREYPAFPTLNMHTSRQKEKRKWTKRAALLIHTCIVRAMVR